jgi:hypothetical protein
LFFIEHSLFALWCYNAVLVEPEAIVSGSSWLRDVRECWTDSDDTDNFQLFYLAKVGMAVEDVLFICLANRGAAQTPAMGATDGSVAEKQAMIEMAVISGGGGGVSGEGGASSSERNARERDVKMMMHHGATAALCLLSALSGYTRVGSLVMLLHDVR